MVLLLFDVNMFLRGERERERARESEGERGVETERERDSALLMFRL